MKVFLTQKRMARCIAMGTAETIVQLRRSEDAPSALIWAPLAMDSAAPLLFGHRPPGLPVCESILAVVRICWAWGFRGLAADVMMATAPCLLALVPPEVRSHRTIVWINRSRRSCGRCRRLGRGQSRRASGRRRGRRCGKRSGWDGHCGLRQSCSRAATSHRCTAIVLLRLGPRQFCCRSEAGIAVVWQGRRRTRQQPAQKRNEQQEAQKTTCRDDACEISPRPRYIEIAPTSDIFIGRFLDVFA